jgi:hypothetical protein
VSPSKVEAILKEKAPTMKKGIRQFLGIANYHRRFIKDYTHITCPLHKLTKDVPYVWTNMQEDSFQALKEALVCSPMLALPKDHGKFHLETVTSDVATGVVLSQEQEDGLYKPLGYISKSFNEAEQHYTTYDKELLGIMRALEDWRNLLIGAEQPFEILTDHCNLTYFHDPQKLTGQQVNWTTKLQDFDFVIKHVGGNTNRRADTLSRPENIEKVTAKVDTVLLDCFFIRCLSHREEEEE